jgi:hypothetical protein
MLKSFNANMQRNVTDLRDRSRIEMFDPSNGNVAGQEYAYGIDPTNKYAQDAATTRERMQQNGQNARHNPMTFLQDREGNYFLVNSQTGQKTPMGIQGPAARGAGQEMTVAQRLKGFQDEMKYHIDPFDNSILPGHEARVQEIEAERAALLGLGGGAGGTSGDEPENLAEAPQQPLPIGSYAAEFGIPQTTLPTEDKREAAIARMMRETGKSREEILAFLQARGLR